MTEKVKGPASCFPSIEAKAAAAGAVQGLLGARDAAETNAADVAAMLRQITTSL